MTFFPTRLWASLLMMAGLCAFSGRAQQTIQFSKPVADATDKANSFMTPGTTRKNSSGAYNAPTPLFGSGWGGATFDVLPGSSPPAPPSSPAEAQQWKKFIEGKTKWAMMTPEEILGLPTAEKIMGLPDKYGEDKLSPEERFLKRQERAAFSTATNSYRRQGDSWMRNDASPFDQQEGSELSSRPGNRANPGGATFFNQGLNNRAGGLFGALPNENSPWAGAFTPPAQPPPQTPEQLAGMERFRALMEPSSPPDKLMPTRVTALPVPDSNLQPVPLFNPLGHSFTPLQNNVSQPTRLKPLPGITGPYAPPTPTKSAGRADLPPWLSEDSATPKFGVPQRKF